MAFCIVGKISFAQQQKTIQQSPATQISKQQVEKELDDALNAAQLTDDQKSQSKAVILKANAQKREIRPVNNVSLVNNPRIKAIDDALKTKLIDIMGSNNYAKFVAAQNNNKH